MRERESHIYTDLVSPRQRTASPCADHLKKRVSRVGSERERERTSEHARERARARERGREGRRERESERELYIYTSG